MHLKVILYSLHLFHALLHVSARLSHHQGEQNTAENMYETQAYNLTKTCN
jgi:hypothetical protein